MCFCSVCSRSSIPGKDVITGVRNALPPKNGAIHVISGGGQSAGALD